MVPIVKPFYKQRNDLYNLFTKTHVRIKIYQEFYHGVIYIANEGRNVRIMYKIIFLWSCKKTGSSNGEPDICDFQLIRSEY